MDLSPVAQAMSSLETKPSKNEGMVDGKKMDQLQPDEVIPKPLGDEGMGDGEKTEQVQPDEVIPKPLGDEGMGDGEKTEQVQPDEVIPIPSGDEGMGEGEKMEQLQPDEVIPAGEPPKTNMPASSGGPTPPTGSVFDQDVRQVSKEVMKQNVE